MAKEKFTVTEEHIKLLKNSYISWNDGEFGAAGINTKKPYGNGNVLSDLAELLDIPNNKRHEDDDAYYKPQDLERIENVHREIETVLQILVTNCTDGLKTGTYIKDEYGVSWKFFRK